MANPLFTEFESPGDPLPPLGDIKKEIESAVHHLETNRGMTRASYLVSMYLSKLRQEFPGLPFFPETLLPAPKDVLKRIGFFAADYWVREQHQLKKYQEEGFCLSYVKFQPMTKKQWDDVTNKDSDLAGDINFYFQCRMEERLALPRENQLFGSMPNELLHQVERAIPPGYRNILDNCIREYEAEADELHACLRRTASSRTGCLFLVVAVVIGSSSVPLFLYS